MWRPWFSPPWAHLGLIVVFAFFFFSLSTSITLASPNNHLDCDFPTKTCHWEGLSSWSWVHPVSSNLKLDAPLYTDGGYALQINLKESLKMANTIISPAFTLPSSASVACFTFDYTIMVDSSPESNQLSVTLLDQSKSTQTNIWNSFERHNVDAWIRGEVQIEETGTYKLNLTATGESGFIALKGFTFINQHCHTPVCDFESGACGWTSQVTSGDSSFRLIRALFADLTYTADHTSLSSYGHYMYSSVGDTKGDQARLIGPPLSGLQTQCFTFWFFLGGGSVNLALEQKFTSTGGVTRLWESNRTHLEMEWIRVQQTITITKEIRLAFTATAKDLHVNPLAIDDISLTPFACPPPITCTFRDTLCGWKEDRTKRFLSWSLGPGRVSDPSKLKTTAFIGSTGSLLYTDFTGMHSQFNHHKKSIMELLSEFVDPPRTGGGACALIDYKVVTITLATDSFYLETIDISGHRTVVWSFKSTDQRNAWRTAQVFLPKATSGSSPYRLALTVKSSNPGTYLGVRSVTYTTDLTQCGHGQPTVSPTTVSTITLSPAKTLNCDFESEASPFCNWKSPFISSATSAFIRGNRKGYAFPYADHTSQSAVGHFVYLSTDDKREPKSAILEGKNPFEDEESFCFTFAYYFYAAGVSSFNLTDDKSSSSSVALFTAYGANEDIWRVALFTVTPTSETSTFTFRASITRGTLALDDISVKPGKCPTKVSGETVCNFERNTTCILEPLYEMGIPKWEVYPASQFGIPDHTTHTLDGHYYGLDLKDFGGQSSSLKRSTIISRHLDGHQVRCLTFSYLLAHVHPNTSLLVHLDTVSGVGFRTESQTKEWTVASSTLGHWFTHKASIWPEVDYLDLRIAIQTMGEPSGKVLLDDILLSKAACLYPQTCDFESGTVCNLETVLYTGSTVTGTQSQFFCDSPVFTRLTVQYLTDYVDRTWSVLEARQSSGYVPVDATLGTSSGHYLLFTVDYTFDRAIMITERYNLQYHGGSICLGFSVYSRYDSSVLELYQGESANETYGTKIWDLRRKTKWWESFEILATPFDKESVDIFFYIVGTIKNAEAFLGLDDLLVKRECTNPVNIRPTTVSPGVTGTTLTPTANPNVFTCKDGTVIPIAKTCDYVKDCTGGEDEEYCGTCYWNSHHKCRYLIDNDPHFAFKFRDQVAVGPAASLYDESQDFLVASGPTGRAALTSPTIQQSYLSCTLTFAYYYNSTEPDNRNIYNQMELYLEIPNLGKKVLIWQSSFSPQGNATWQLYTFPFRRVHHPFRITFNVGQTPLVAEQIHALDRLRVAACGPPKPTTGISCSGESDFRCANKICVDAVDVCDFEDDCGDGSDERACDTQRATDFENGRGLWGQGVSKGWRLASTADFSDLRKGPTFDHSTEYNWGSFLFTSLTYNHANATLLAEIDSPPFTIGERCRFQYFVFKNSPSSTLLVVLRNLYTGREIKLNEIGSINPFWTRYSNLLQYAIKSAEKNDLFKIVISATLKATSGAFVDPYIGLDDLAFSAGCSIKTGAITRPTLPNHSVRTTPKPDACPTISCLDPKGKKICLADSQLCDFTNQCADGSDETNCGECTFEEGLCDWVTYGSVNKWTVLKPASEAPGELPKKDAYGWGNGGYLSIQTMDNSASPSQIRSPEIYGHTLATCKLRFSFLSNTGATLSVILNHQGTSDTLYTRKQPAKQWTSLSVDVGLQTAPFTLELYGHVATKYGLFRDIAVDNLVLVDCKAKKGNPTVKPPTVASITCAFEADLCGWQVTGLNGRSNWARTSDSNSEPGNDHTSLRVPRPAQYGTWMTTQARSSSSSASTTADYLVTTVSLKKDQTYCLSFWYYYLGIDTGSFFGLYASKSGNASKTPDSDPDYTPLWKTVVPQSRNWNQRYIEIPGMSSNFYLLFIAHVDASGIIGLDDTNLTTGACQVVDPEFCDFETNTCDWTIQSGAFKRSPSSRTFPDHTTGTGNGHYLADSLTQKAAILSKPFANQPIFLNSKSTYISKFCLRFYYYFDADFSNGALSDNSSAITVQILEKGINPVTSSIKLVDVLNDGLLHTWSLFQYSLYGSRDGYLEIDALRAAASTKVLLDDISLQHGDCNYKQGCDFEYDNCGWTNMASSSSNVTNLLWLRVQPNSRYIRGRSLSFDHTTNSRTGHYLVLPLAMQANANALLRSPLYKNFKTACFTMAYFAQASNFSIHALTVQMDDLTRDRRTSVQVNATRSFHWTNFETQFDHLPSVFVISIIASNIRGLTSDIGIDDLQLKYGPCSGGHVPTTTTPLPVSEKKLDCNFDSGACNWKYNAKVYKAGNFADQKNNYAPQRDHNIGATSGRYLLFQDSAPAQTSYSLTTTAGLTADRDHCLTFWYYDDGEDPFTIKLIPLLYGHYLWEIDFDFSIESRRRWTLLKADIARTVGGSDGLQIAYAPTASRRKDFSIFALDDLSVRPGKCSHLHDYVYTFSAGFQDLELEYVQPLQKAIGSRITPQTSLPAGAPAVDHTTGTAKGTYFLFANQATLAPTTYITTLSLMDLPADGDYTCVRFAYQTKGNVQLKVFVASPDARVSYYKSGTPLWSSNYSTNGWTIGEVNKRVTYTHKVVFYMVKPADKISYVALDDLTILGHSCQAPIDCDFESGICSYSPVSVNQYNWGLFTAPAVDKAWPGPTFDHTTRHIGSGYLFLTAFRSVGDFTTPVVSRIVSGSRQVKPGKSYCLSMWTRLTTADLALKLSLLRYGASWTDSNRTLVLGSKANLMQADWTQVTFQILPTNLLDALEAQLLIEGTLGVNSKGLIALDDISLTEGACAANTLICEDGTTLNQTQICNFHKDCPSGLDELNCGNCDFEQGTCGWGNRTTWPQKWLLTSASESHRLKVPAFDGNANRTGHYLLLGPPSVGSASNGETALNFGSPANYLKNAYQTCVLQFDYFISTYDAYSLNVRMGSDNDDWDNVYLIQRDSKGGWRRAYAHIGERYSDFMTAIIGHLEDGNTGIMAVDNMQFTNCSLPTPLAPGKTCASGQTLCKVHRFCIHHDDICDFANNCGDEQDELNCNAWTRCNFEHGYTDCDVATDDMEAKRVWDVNVEWNIYQGRLARDPYDPQIDSTLRSGKGSYIQLATRTSPHNTPWKQTYTAEFYSTMVTAKSGQACRMRFFFFINGDAAYISATYLDIFVRYASKLTVEPQRLTRLQLNAAGDLQQRWNKAVVSFTSTAPFQFVFRGKLGTNYSRVAVDDITFDYDNCAHSNTKPLTPSTSAPTRSTSGSHSEGPVTVTPKPTVNRPSPKSGVGGKIAAGILIPVFLILGAVGGFFAFRRYQRKIRGAEGITLSMQNIQRNMDD